MAAIVEVAQDPQTTGDSVSRPSKIRGKHAYRVEQHRAQANRADRTAL